MISRLKGWLLEASRTEKRLIAFAIDCLACIFSVLAANLLRTDVLEWPVGIDWLPYVVALSTALPLFVAFGLYRAIFRFAGWGSLLSVFKACLASGVVFAIVFAVIGVDGVPRTMGILQPILMFLFVGATRAAARLWLGGRHQKFENQERLSKALIYGAGAAGHQLAGILSDSREIEVAGFIDENPALDGSSLNGKRIYFPSDLKALVEKLQVSEILLAMPSVSRSRRNQILHSLRDLRVNVRTLPGLMDLAHGAVTKNDLRDVDIEELLGREPVEPDPEIMRRTITNKTILVTGAGGSIGSELCRQILSQNPADLILVETSEFNLYSIHHELEEYVSRVSEISTNLYPVLGSVQDTNRMTEIIQCYKPETVYHAAAYKHVPIVEHNPEQGIRNNVFGTFTMASLSKDNGVSNFVLVSTDKAVRPTSVMGASKRLSEMVVQALSDLPGKTTFSMVRFGNVLGSSGSVVPLFRRLIKERRPITITHPEITRYFMTIPEAAQLVIQAGSMAETGDVFVLDMGAPVRILDLANRMIELSGLTLRDEANPGGDIAIEFVGLRPGEKLYEELLIGDNPMPTKHPRIMKARDGFVPWPVMSKILNELETTLAIGDPAATINILKSAVPEFVAKDNIVDWVWLRSQGAKQV